MRGAAPRSARGTPHEAASVGEQDVLNISLGIRSCQGLFFRHTTTVGARWRAQSPPGSPAVIEMAWSRSLVMKSAYDGRWPPIQQMFRCRAPLTAGRTKGIIAHQPVVRGGRP